MSLFGLDYQRAEWASRSPGYARTRVGLDLLYTGDAPAASGAWNPPRLDAYGELAHLTGPVPEGAPDGTPWILWRGHRGDVEAGVGLDANGIWWGIVDRSGLELLTDPKGPKRRWKGGWADVEIGAYAWMDDVEAFGKNVVLPTLLAVGGALATAAGGVVVGIAVAAILSASMRIAQGGRVSDALIKSVREALPSLVASGVFDKTIARAKSSGLVAMYDYGKLLVTGSEREAFEKAKVLAIAQVSQDESFQQMRAQLSTDRQAVLDRAVLFGAAPMDVANAMGGDQGRMWMDHALRVNAATGSGMDIAPGVEGAYVPIGAGSGSSSGTTVAVVVGGIVALVVLVVLL